MKRHSFILFVVFCTLVISACRPSRSEVTVAENEVSSVVDSITYQIPRALLASRFPTLDSLCTVIELLFSDSTLNSAQAGVHMTYLDNGLSIESDLNYGLTQGDILDVRDGDVWGKIVFVSESPFSIANRVDLNRIYKLARRRPTLFGEGDVAFYDMAELSVKNINITNLAYPSPKDSSEKGYINTFNHVTAQALITTLFNEELADFVADVHERHHMPELLTGKFKPEQLLDVDNNPVDNYVDIINNELGQEIGLVLKTKYGITRETIWTPNLLANYLNDLQQYYCWSFGISMTAIEESEQSIIRFADKINEVGGDIPYGMHKPYKLLDEQEP